MAGVTYRVVPILRIVRNFQIACIYYQWHVLLASTPGQIFAFLSDLHYNVCVLASN